MSLPIKPAQSCAYDQISLGEVMLRLDPGEGRIRTAREFKVWEGGGEYNVARGLRRCFGLKTAVASAFPEPNLALRSARANLTTYFAFNKQVMEATGLMLTHLKTASGGAVSSWSTAHPAICTGLPPTPLEVQNFVGDASPQAFAKVVDRLLASPAYGEKWGRHWLDLARFAALAERGPDVPYDRESMSATVRPPLRRGSLSRGSP